MLIPTDSRVISTLHSMAKYTRSGHYKARKTHFHNYHRTTQVYTNANPTLVTFILRCTTVLISGSNVGASDCATTSDYSRAQSEKIQ